MSTPTAKVRLLRPVCIAGRPHDRGTVLELDVETALDCVEMARGTFVDVDDRERCLQARREAIRKMVKTSTSFLQPLAADAWQRMH